MKILNRQTAAAAVLIAGATFGSMSAASAHPSTDTHTREHGTRVFEAKLEELNYSGASGTATLRLTGNRLNVHIRARGLAPTPVHAQHIPGMGNSECPTQDLAGEDDVLTTAEG